jgi:hypothetical protein
MQALPPAIEVYPVHHLPILKAYADQLGLVSLINHYVPTAMEVDAGTGFCRKVVFLRPNVKIVCRKINGLQASTFLFSIICDRTAHCRRSAQGRVHFITTVCPSARHTCPLASVRVECSLRHAPPSTFLLSFVNHLRYKRA